MTGMQKIQEYSYVLVFIIINPFIPWICSTPNSLL